MKDNTIHRMEVVEGGKRIEGDVLRATREFLLIGHRKGQALMNGLGMKAPELYDILTGTLADCFNDDRKIPAALKELGFKSSKWLEL